MAKDDRHFHAALIDVDDVLDPVYVKMVAAAIERQVNEHFAPFWHVTANITAGVSNDEHPLRIEVRNEVDPARAGYHQRQEDGQPIRPYAVVNLMSLKHKEMWPRVASHELLEMLADPWGNLTILGPDLDGTERMVDYILEVGDPCNLDSYTLDEYPDVPVSDFVYPDYYDLGAPGPYSHSGTIAAPLDVREGGYVAFLRDGQPWWKIFRPGTDGAFIERVPHAVALGGCLREEIDAVAREHLP